MTDSRKEFEGWCSANSHFRDTTKDGDGAQDGTGHSQHASGRRSPVSLLVTQRDAEIAELKQRVEALRTDARAAVDYVMATNLQLCRLELSVRQTANLAWGAEFRLNKALALDTAKEKQND
ncbi:MAG: hypothetical protein COX32_01220 [Candidatus Moranbacteria bacterium CG23_combo_of_CG06-09_8_20_14_all_41_28]|nr:MAG: hypothetical protein COX32_01220 [Candidatus Moranbacteria bacterium CG23_combo_of_CG06-09_8_20_14_all_41_28]